MVIVEQSEKVSNQRVTVHLHFLSKRQLASVSGYPNQRAENLFSQVSNRLVTGSCENDLDLAGECRWLTSVAHCDAVDRQRLLCSARHCACSKSGRSAKDTTGAGVDPTSESGDLPVLRAAPAVLNGKPLAALAART
jgi:hypothetical protein